MHAPESETGKIKLFDKHIDDANRIILCHIIVQVLRQQRTLSAFLALNKALHVASLVMRYWLNVY